ncbi:hypothetical protein SUGI_0503470 [Cryptomeria japonica]|uniref:calcium uniporter protein 4, mitochondrial n=1 Tax=Cryptomeria japonica TaxID=3369 RepID=UPI002408AA78|nr:calcium uniporter protein 4, mitochondrial [Cryptomeria japonica]GLJ26220.1 hypothetical protein SUGI_0503470 [Cryptomeria japonica]
MAASTYRALRQVWRPNPMLHRSTQKGHSVRVAHLGNPLPCFMHCREFIGVSQAQIHPSVFYGDLLRKNMDDIISHEMPGLDQIRPPMAQKITVEDARKFLRLARMESLKRSLNQIPQDSISYNEFLQVCREALDPSSEKEAMALAKLLDESGHILVIGRKVHLRPDKVARAIEEAIALSPAAIRNPCRAELADLEKQKAEIDVEAEKRTKAELWWGLGIFAAKTAIFIRWTFWDLSWDVMEPLCFFVTSFYFMAGYVFFLTTSSPPTFGGFFRARFLARQRQLMKQRNFDLHRFKHLQMLSMPRFNYDLEVSRFKYN